MTIRAVDLRCAGFVSPIGVAPNPRLSWRLEAAERHVIQVAAQVQLATDPSFADIAWDSGRVEQRRSAVVAPVTDGADTRRRWWRVRVWTNRDDSGWSEPAWFEPGRSSADAWTAQFISAPTPSGGGPDPVPAVLFRKAFTLDGPPRHARVAATALGVYEITINGVRVGDEELAPGWSAYRSRIAVSTFDVTALLREGDNVIAATVAEGWYRGRIGVSGSKWANYGTHLGLLAELDVELASGATVSVATDPTWTSSSSGPVVASGIYDGETVDLRREPKGWTEPGFDGRAWEPTVVLGVDRSVLFNRWAPPVRRVDELAPVGHTMSSSGNVIVDFGQNLVGWLRIPVGGPKGATVTIRHAEILDEHGDLFTRALNDAKATDTYTLDGGGRILEPRFTFHGFRYAEITVEGGAQVDLEQVRAVVITSDNARTGTFQCSDPQVNRLQANIEWGWRGNSVSLPTDCPQRSERLGWTGDAQVFASTASFLTDADRFLASWLADVAAQQHEDGSVPMVVPDMIGERGHGAAAWGDVATVMPWALYEAYGDREILSTQYPSMKAWVDYEAERAGDDLIWDSNYQFGDWCDPAAPPDKPGSGTTDRHLVAQAEFVRSARIVARAADVLGEDDDAARYTRLAGDAAAAFRERYLDVEGLPTSRTQAACALILAYELVDAECRVAVGDLLVELVRANGNRLATGFVGTPVLLPALTSIGRTDVAYDLFLQQECPSWLYPLRHGATTIWERWDAIQPDGSIHPGRMLSFNHYAYGAVGAWMYRTVAGLAPDAPGYERIRFAPIPGGGLTSAQARLQSVNGSITSAWQIEGGSFRHTVEIPPNSTGIVVLRCPVADVQLDGAPLLPSDPGVLGVAEGVDGGEVQLGSGTYELLAPMRH